MRADFTDDQVLRLRNSGYSNNKIAGVFKVPVSVIDRVVRALAKPVPPKPKPKHSAIWSELREALLRELWAEGLSGSNIAAELNRKTRPPKPFTRNAIIGKADRMGLPPRGRESRHWAGERRKSRKNKNQGAVKRATVKSFGGPLQTPNRLVGLATLPNSENVPLPLEQPEDIARVASVADLEPHHCRWPIGDPKGNFKGFCGCKKAPGSPYCEHHTLRATQRGTILLQQPQILEAAE
ncbi:MAG: GcrA family cell cycle regulator [Filomicrobium sp.]